MSRIFLICQQVEGPLVACKSSVPDFSFSGLLQAPMTTQCSLPADRAIALGFYRIFNLSAARPPPPQAKLQLHLAPPPLRRSLLTTHCSLTPFKVFGYEKTENHVSHLGHASLDFASDPRALLPFPLVRQTAVLRTYSGISSCPQNLPHQNTAAPVASFQFPNF